MQRRPEILILILPPRQTAPPLTTRVVPPLRERGREAIQPHAREANEHADACAPVTDREFSDRDDVTVGDGVAYGDNIFR